MLHAHRHDAYRPGHAGGLNFDVNLRSGGAFSVLCAHVVGGLEFCAVNGLALAAVNDYRDDAPALALPRAGFLAGAVQLDRHREREGVLP